jgi:hypothetical protein
MQDSKMFQSYFRESKLESELLSDKLNFDKNAFIKTQTPKLVYKRVRAVLNPNLKVTIMLKKFRIIGWARTARTQKRPCPPSFFSR